MVSNKQGLQLQSLITEDGTLTLSLKEVAVPKPSDDEVVVRVEAAVINPSDLLLLLGPADLTTAEVTGTPERPVLKAKIPSEQMFTVKARLGKPMTVGYEGAGTVIAAGASDAAQALLGTTVGAGGGDMYAQYRCTKAAACIPMPEGTQALEAAACFVTPLTALSIIETMKEGGRTALVNTAAASNVGQFINRICLKDGFNLVNIVRREEQVQILRDAGAKYICNSSDDDFSDQLHSALTATGATIAFDATAGGSLVSQILRAMEVAAIKSSSEYSRYGSDTYKQAYIYGGLDKSPTILEREFGMWWGIGGWSLLQYLQRTKRAKFPEMKERVSAEINTTFKTDFTHIVTLAEFLQAETLQGCLKKATGEKYVIRPHG